jgi:DNA mismatch repair protein MutS
MLDQYRRIKREHQDSVLFFRLGDFYEMFAEDALEVSSLLNLTLTSRNGLPMCGVPYHAGQTYIARLLRHGKKVAVCEQVSEPGKSKLIDRRVTEIVTPGTTIEENYLEKGSANYLASLALSGGVVSFAYIDLSTGGFYATSFPAEQAVYFLGLELERLEVRELIAAESLLKERPDLAMRLEEKRNLVINRWADWLFDRQKSAARLCRQFGVSNLKGFGLDDTSPEIIAAGALLDYLDDTAKSLIPHVSSLTVYTDGQYAAIDEATQRNLELMRNFRDGTEQYSLFEVIDETRTAMGRRLLKRRLLHPLIDVSAIRRRLDMTEGFYRNQETLGTIRNLLAKTPDLERLSSRLAMDKAHGKDMVSVMNALFSLDKFKDTILKKNAGLFESPEAAQFTEADFTELEKIRALLEKGLCENPSTLLTEGNLIRRGYNDGLDKLHRLKEKGRNLLEEYLEKEKAITGISGLKIRYNRLIGYYFEVTKNQLSRVPPYFIRRQGIVSGERFSTEHLAKLESDINGASDRIIEMEKQLFLEIRGKTKAQLGRISAAAKLIAELDAGQSLAWAATARGWIRPEVDYGTKTIIAEGRHPVVEAHLPGGEFIPNDVRLEGDGVFFALITGPNMAGKSTYLRQAALITIMAQIGSFVPARDALVGITDRIYCRVGASDNLARGESTFLVEMNETAHILHSATERSLVIMDEIGRGTGTADGLAIAWAVSEEILRRIRCRTLFATHFHELSELEDPGLANRSMEVVEDGNNIIFLRKLKECPGAESYGLYAAGLAGLPSAVLERARVILDGIRQKGVLPQPSESAAATPSTAAAPSTATAPGTIGENDVIRELSALDTNAITPLEALNAIHRWKKLIQEDGHPGEKNNQPKTKPVKQKSDLFDEFSLFD